MNTTRKTRVLFVDDEPQILQIIDLLMEPLKDEWETAFAPDALQALAMIEKEPFDVVVSDMRMPKMSGAQLFAQIQHRWPQTARIILSGYAEPDQIAQAVLTAHQFLRKPFVLNEFLATLLRVQQLNQWVMNDNLRRLVGKMSNLPSVPSVYYRISEALNSPHTQASDIAQIVASDPALMAKMLQLVNSAFFGFSRPVSNAMEAVLLLGMNNIRSLAMTAEFFSSFDMMKLGRLPVQEICGHGLRVGHLAVRIAKRERQTTLLLEQALTAGTLQNLGQLILAANLPAQYSQVYQSAKSQAHLLQEERRAFGASHADVGAYLLGVWGLPAPLVEAVAFHHDPSRSPDKSFTPLTAVHAATGLVQEAASSVKIEPFDTKYLARLGLLERLDTWRQCFQAPS